MNAILFPTDFSENATNALDYAVKIASDFNSKLILLHSYHMPVTTPDMAYADQHMYDEELKGKFKEQLGELKGKIQANHPNLVIDVKVNYGFAVDTILSYQEDENADLVVMGTKGASGLKRVVFGSITASVISKCKCPVLAIPDEAEYSGISKIVFATDLHNTQSNITSAVVEFASKFDARLEVVYIKTDTELDEEEDMLIDKLNSVFNYKKVSFHIEVMNDVEEGLEQFVSKHKPDIVALVTHKRGFFSKLFHQSVTSEMAYHGHTPVLAFHDED